MDLEDPTSITEDGDNKIVSLLKREAGD